MRPPAGERFIGLLGYLPLVCYIIARYVKRDSLFVQFHARQGAVLFTMWASLFIVCSIALMFVDSIATVTVSIFVVLAAATAIYLLLMLVAMLKVLLGERYRMPVVADVALKMGL